MNMKSTVAVGATLAVAAAFAATPQIDQENVSLSQGVSRLITINYTLEDAPGIVTADIQTNRGDGVYCSIGGRYLANMYGDVNSYQQTGAHQIHWQPDQAWPNHKLSVVDGGVRAVVTAWATNCPPDYMAVSAVVANDVRFYASAEAVPGGVTNDLYKRDVVLMRKIPAAGVRWRMGSLPTENGYNAKYETARYVTLTKDYYMGVYMLTQKQYKLLVSATLPGSAEDVNSPDSDIHAMNCICANAIRGNRVKNTGCTSGGDYDWPNTTPKHKVGPDSIVGMARAFCGNRVEFDIPTSAQWEFACRAGTCTSYNNGSDTNYDEVAWCCYNGYKTETGADDNSHIHAVGLKKPNAYGLYDMHGPHFENVLDWYGPHQSSEEVVDPEGPTTGGSREVRGGTYRGKKADGSLDTVDNLAYTRSGNSSAQDPSKSHSRFGMRFCAPAIYFAPAE